MSRLLATLTGRRSWIVALVGLLLGVALIGGVGQAERDASALDTLPAGFDSTQGQGLLDELPDEGSKAAIVLFTAEEGIEESLPDLATLLEDVAPEGTQAPSGGTGQVEGETGGQAPEGAEGEAGHQPGGEASAEGGPPPGLTGEFPVIPAEDGTAAISVLDLDAPTATETAEVVSTLRADLADGVPEG
ncbi:hypothetical protein [Serinicoccus marinus]|nr:hypothetical protein [Serinicoccus marinus]